MRRLAESWPCLAVIVALALFSFFAGSFLELGTRSVVHTINHSGSDAALPLITVWMRDLFSPSGCVFLLLCSYPTLLTAAYFLNLVRKETDEAVRNTRFALVALAAFILEVTFLVLGGFALSFPFFNILTDPIYVGGPPIVQIVSEIIFYCLIAVNVILLILLVRPPVSSTKA
jgi:hypothetical protein